MARKDGSITEIKKSDGSSYRPKHWKVRVDRGRDPITKKRNKPLQRNVIGTKAEAKQVLDELREQARQGVLPKSDVITFAEFSEQWHEARVVGGEVGKTRLARETSIINDLNHYIGAFKLYEITPQTIDSLYIQLRKDKIAKLGHYSGTTLHMVHVVLHQILKQAMNYDLIPKNPADRVKAPKCDTPDRRSLSVGEVRSLLVAVDEAEEAAYSQRQEIEARRIARKDERQPLSLRGLSSIGNAIAVRLALATGMRRGEILGLTWGSIDFDRGTLRVTQSITTYGELKGPKSEAGKRLICLDDVTLEHLRVWKGRQRDEFKQLSLVQTSLTPVCNSDKGSFTNPSLFSRWWRSFAKDNGFPGLKFHELRHTQATQLIANGMDIKTVQHRLGHSSAALTMNLYAHALPETDRRAADMIGTLLFEPQGERGTYQNGDQKLNQVV